MPCLDVWGAHARVCARANVRSGGGGFGGGGDELVPGEGRKEGISKEEAGGRGRKFSVYI